MKIYVIRIKDRVQQTFEYMPELTASLYSARTRRAQLEQDYIVTIDEYEVKTQGPNFNHIANKSARIK